MKWLIAIGFLTIVPGLCLADQRLNVDVPGGGAADLLNMTTIPSDISDRTRDPSVQRYCTNPSGRIIRQGEDGYQRCLRLAQGKKPLAQPSISSDHGIVIHSKPIDQ